MLFPTSFAFDFPRLLPPNAKMIGPLLPEPALFPFKGDAELSTFVAEVRSIGKHISCQMLV